MRRRRVVPKQKMAAMKFHCRKCRQFLFCGDDLATNHVQKKECSSWYLRDDDEMPSWTYDLINESGWTEGKLYCPKCKGRIGGFDFLHIVHCSCLNDVIPAIWCPKSRIDQIVNIDLKDKGCKEIQTLNEASESSSKSVDIETTASQQCYDNTTVSEGAKDDEATDGKSKQTQALKEGCIPKNTRFFRNCHSSMGIYDGIFMTPEDTNLSTGSSSSNLNSEKMLNDTRIVESILDRKEIRDPTDHHCLCQHNQCCVTKTQFCHHCCHCGKDNDGCNTACIATNLCCESVSHIHESIREIRKEIVDLYSTRNDGLKNGGRNQKKPRRRGRGNWQHECDYLKAMDDMKRNSAEKDMDPPTNLLVSRPRERAHSFIMEEKELSDSEIPDSYKCAVCLSLLHQPHQTPCQHVFCGICMKQLHHVSRGRPKCPLCREPITYVIPEEEMEAEIQVSFPVNYRKRAKETRKNRHRKGVLPSPQTTRFDSTEESETRNTSSRVVHHLSVIALIISIVINSILINAHGNAAVRLDLQRKLAIFVLIVLGIMVASLVLLLLIVFALDFVKVALFLVLSYVAMSKLVLTAVLD